MKYFFEIMALVFLSCFGYSAEAEKLQINGSKVSFAPLITNPNGDNPYQHQPTDKIWVESPVMRISCYQKRIPGTHVYNGCDEFTVNGVAVGTYEHQGQLFNIDSKDISLKKIKNNEFTLPDITVEYSKKNGGYLCVLIASPYLGGLPSTGPPTNIYYYSGDRYSLLSYCNRHEIPEWGLYSARFANRQEALSFFTARLRKSIPVRVDKDLLEKALK